MVSLQQGTIDMHVLNDSGPFSSSHSYNAIKAYMQEGRQTELSAGEHLVSAAEAGQFEKEPPVSLTN